MRLYIPPPSAQQLADQFAMWLAITYQLQVTIRIEDRAGYSHNTIIDRVQK